MNIKVFAAVVVFLSNFKFCQSKDYNEYRLYKAVPKTKDQLKFLTNLEKQKYLEVNFWKRPSKLHHDVHFIVSPTDGYMLLERAKHFSLDLELLISNIQRSINGQVVRRYVPLRENNYSWDSYHDLEDVYQWLSDVETKFPKIAKLEVIGTSIEGRIIHAVSINRKNTLKEKIILESGIHGTDWVGVEFMTYMIHQLVYAEELKDPVLLRLAKKYHWLIIPIVNPDGYDYTHKLDRLWVKNRRKHPDKHTYGVNLNRNFDYSFGKFCSNDTSDEEYCGSEAFSEPESKAVADFVTKNKEKLKFYFSFHSYGQTILLPYSDRVKHIDNFGEMENYGKQAIQRIYKTTKLKYGIGTTYDTYGLQISGTSESWVKRTLKVRYVATFQMRDNGTFGYLLPAEHIIPSCQDAMLGLFEIMTARPKYLRSMYTAQAEHLRYETFAIVFGLFCAVLINV